MKATPEQVQAHKDAITALKVKAFQEASYFVYVGDSGCKNAGRKDLLTALTQTVKETEKAITKLHDKFDRMYPEG